MKLIAVTAICALFICLTEARSKIALELKELEELLRRQAGETTTEPPQTTTAAPPPPPPEHACDSITQDEWGKIEDKGEEMKSAVMEMFHEIALTANQFPEPPKFTCDVRFDKVVGFLDTIERIAANDIGEQFIEQVADFLMDLAALSIYDPKGAQELIDYLNQSGASKKKRSSEESSGIVERYFQRRQGGKYSNDTFVEGIMHRLCETGKLGDAGETNIEKVIEDGMWAVRGSTSILRAIRSLSSVEGAPTVLFSIGYFLDYLADALDTDTQVAEQIMQYAVNEYDSYRAHLASLELLPDKRNVKKGAAEKAVARRGKDNGDELKMFARQLLKMMETIQAK